MARINYIHLHQGVFSRFAKIVARLAGHPAAFSIAVTFLVLWALSGPLFGFSDTWQLVINTGTTIVTFLMVFVIQNTQNSDTMALHIKIDELLRSLEAPNAALIDLEELDPEELTKIRRSFEKLAEEGRTQMRSGKDDPYKPQKKKGKG